MTEMPHAIKILEPAEVIDELIAAHPDRWQQFKLDGSGLGWWFGQAMKASHGKLNPQAAAAYLQQQREAKEH